MLLPNLPKLERFRNLEICAFWGIRHAASPFLAHARKAAVTRDTIVARGGNACVISNEGSPTIP
jgi:hypothetical protein